jgi:hypothetical protein
MPILMLAVNEATGPGTAKVDAPISGRRLPESGIAIK